MRSKGIRFSSAWMMDEPNILRRRGLQVGDSTQLGSREKDDEDEDEDARTGLLFPPQFQLGKTLNAFPLCGINTPE